MLARSMVNEPRTVTQLANFLQEKKARFAQRGHSPVSVFTDLVNAGEVEGAVAKALLRAEMIDEQKYVWFLLL